MSKIISLNTPIDTPFCKIGAINWNWKPKEINIEHLPGTKIGEMKVKGLKEITIPIKIITSDNAIDATIDFKDRKNMIFWIKQELFEHIYRCEKCLRYVIIHEFTHTGKQFQFTIPDIFNNIDERKINAADHYLVDAWVDRWNIINKNYEYNYPMKFLAHMEKTNFVDFKSTNREEFFENYIYITKFVTHSKIWRNNLYQHTYRFPHEFQDKYQKLLDILSTDYTGPDQEVYYLIRDIAELVLNQGILDDYISEPSESNSFNYSYFIKNNEGAI